MNLTIGGLDIWATHTTIIGNLFDPRTFQLELILIDPSTSESAVALGNGGTGAPLNYAVAFENNTAAPLDPFYINTQNWVGTYNINPANAVPEPSALALMLLPVCLYSFGYIRRRAYG